MDYVAWVQRWSLAQLEVEFSSVRDVEISSVKGGFSFVKMEFSQIKGGI